MATRAIAALKSKHLLLTRNKFLEFLENHYCQTLLTSLVTILLRNPQYYQIFHFNLLVRFMSL